MDREHLQRLQDLPNIGPAGARDLQMSGILTPADLIGRTLSQSTIVCAISPATSMTIA